MDPWLCLLCKHNHRYAKHFNTQKMDKMSEFQFISICMTSIFLTRFSKGKIPYLKWWKWIAGGHLPKGYPNCTDNSSVLTVNFKDRTFMFCRSIIVHTCIHVSEMFILLGFIIKNATRLYFLAEYMAYRVLHFSW